MIIPKLIIHFLLVFGLSFTAVFGDYLLNSSKSQFIRAVCDNITHGLIGGFTWWIICNVHKTGSFHDTVIEIILCILIASLIDLDHFFAAHSLYLKDAINLNQRPVLHCSTVPVLILGVLIMVGYLLENNWMFRLAFIVFAAFCSHHTRDATRRGYWFYPFGSTPPLPYAIYIILTILIPYAVIFFISWKPTGESFEKLKSIVIVA